MRIGIDASRIEGSHRTGTENYAYEVITRLIKIDTRNQYILYSRRSLDLHFGEANVENKVLKFPVLWTHIRLSWEMLLHAPDMLFIPAHTVPLIHPRNTVAVIHGVEYEHFPQAYSGVERLKNRIGTLFSSKKARMVITPSECTKTDLEHFYHISPEKIRVVYPGFSLYNEQQGLDKENAIKTPYLLYIGRIEERKNISRIIYAFEKLKRDKKIPHILVLAGKNGYGVEKITRQIAVSEYRHEIILTGYVDESKKQYLLRNADVFLFPTLYEGFGFPILEAMSAGVPVVTSNIGSAAEVAGNAALLVNPESIDEIANSVYKVVSDQRLSEELVRKGYENVKRFDWEKCVEDILNIIDCSSNEL